MSELTRPEARGLMPDPERTVSEWADDFRVLSQESSAEPGRWRTGRTPFARAIMDALSPDHPCERVTFIKGAQIGGTEIGNNWCGYVMDYAPGPMLMVQPNDDLVEKVSKQRLSPMIASTERLSDKVYKDNILEKRFPGGMLMMASANSAAGLRSMPIRFLFLDEIDAYRKNVGGEGDPVSLAIARTRTFPRRKIYECSTPTIRGASRIEQSYLESNQQEYHVPCPECGCLNKLEWPQIKWVDDDPETAHYECPECLEAVGEQSKTWMLDNGQWVAQNPESGDKHMGFRLSTLYAPVGWYSWRDAARDFIKAKKDQDLLMTFVNTVLGETWVVRGDTPAWQSIYDRREPYQMGQVPDTPAEVVTGGVDVQKDRLEVELVAWGPGLESWSIDHIVIQGDPYYQEVWDKLTDVLDRRIPHKSGGSVPISLLAVDSGFATTEVYKWARLQPSDRVMVVKGVNNSSDILGRHTHTQAGVSLWNVGVSKLKSEFYGLLKLRPNTNDMGQVESFPPGYCHFPMYGEEFFRQLASEKQVMETDKRGKQKLVWVQDRPRNEALDLRNYARAAAEKLRIVQYKDRHWDNLKRSRLSSSKAGDIVTPVNNPGHRERRESTWL